MKNKRTQWLVVVFCCTLAVGVFWHGWLSDRPKPQIAKPTDSRFTFPDRIEHFPGKRVTNLVALADFTIDDGMEVAGLVVNGEPRAYLLEGMSMDDSHLAHDSVGGESISVVYCNRLSTVRCMAIPKEQQDEFIVTGWTNDTVQLAFQTNHFSIEADSLPLPEIEVVNTSIAEWRQRHPSSKIYVGDFLDVLESARQRNQVLPSRYSVTPFATPPSRKISGS